MTQSVLPSPAIYLDHAAATPVRPAVLLAMAPYWSKQYGNPSSITRLGVAARTAVEQSRATVSGFLNSHPDEVIFTSGGTESTNLAIRGILAALPEGHIITTAIEHHAVLEPILAAHVGYPATVVPVDGLGRIDPATIVAAIRPETRLVSVMLANNEIGTLQPVAALARILRRINRARQERGELPIYLHTDACQAASYCSLDVSELGVAALSFGGAKIGGPKGSGVLYLRRKTPFQPQIIGGGQERGYRAGTENVPAIVGLARAFQIAQKTRRREQRRLTILRDRLRRLLEAGLPDIVLNGHPTERLPNNLNFTFPGLEAEPLVLYLDQDGVTIGTGAACTSSNLEPSHVLTALGLSRAAALATIRLTLGWTTRSTDITRAARRIIHRVQWLRHHLSPSS